MIEKNKIYLGDSYKAIKEIPDKSIDLIYVDVPYLYDGGGGGDSELSKSIVKAHDDLHDGGLVSGFDYKILDDYVRVNKKVNIIIWFSKLQMQYILNYFLNIPDKEIFFEPLVWCKTNPIPATNNKWLPDLEYAFHFREKGVKLNNGFEIKSKYYISPINTKDKVLYEHPTIKPLEFVKNHILHTTQEGDIVLDTFLGSGTTAVACKELGRNYIGFEINENYYKIATDRLNGITQQEIREKEDGILNIFDFMEE